MRKLIGIIFMIIIASNTYFGMYNEDGERVTDIKEVLERQNLIESQNIEEQESEEKIENEIQEIVEETIVPEEKEEIQVQEEIQKKKEDVVTTTQTITTPKQETKAEVTPKVEETKVEKTEQVINTTPVIEEKPQQESFKCTSTQHFVGCGNTGKWFKTKAEGIAYYDSVQAEYDRQINSGEITYEKYLEKCPYGYEMWTCPMCNEWTINFYYR